MWYREGNLKLLERDHHEALILPNVPTCQALLHGGAQKGRNGRGGGLGREGHGRGGRKYQGQRFPTWGFLSAVYG